MAIQDIQISRFLPKTSSDAEFADVIALQLISFQERNAGDTPRLKHCFVKIWNCLKKIQWQLGICYG
jgi:hypothetical protein